MISSTTPHCSDGSCHVPIFLGTKPSGRAQFPKFVWCAASESIGEGKQGEEKKASSSSSSKSTSIFSWLLNQSPSLSPPAQTSLLFELYTRPTVCGAVADAINFSFVQTAVVLWSALLAFWFGNCTFEFSCTFLVLTKVKVRLDSLLNK